MPIPTRLVIYKASGHEALINVSDFDDAIHADPAAPAAAPPAPVTSGIGSVNGEKAFSMIASADTLEELDTLELDEQTGEKAPGRKGVLRAIAERRSELAGTR